MGDIIQQHDNGDLEKVSPGPSHPSAATLTQHKLDEILSNQVAILGRLDNIEKRLSNFETLENQFDITLSRILEINVNTCDYNQETMNWIKNIVSENLTNSINQRMEKIQSMRKAFGFEFKPNLSNPTFGGCGESGSGQAE